VSERKLAIFKITVIRESFDWNADTSRMVPGSFGARLGLAKGLFERICRQFRLEIDFLVTKLPSG